MRALDRLAGAVRFFTLADGRLAALQGGEALPAAYVAAARAQDELGERPTPIARNGYHRPAARRSAGSPPASLARGGPGATPCPTSAGTRRRARCGWNWRTTAGCGGSA